MFRYASAFAMAVLAILVSSPANAGHKGTCHGAGCRDSLENRLLALEELAPRYFFVTSQAFSGNLEQEAIDAGLGPVLDGPDGADKLCQAAADSPNAIVPVGTYRAWVSTNAVDARDRIDLTFGPYLSPRGEAHATNFIVLLSGTIDRRMSATESG